jgi:hypothetical protein
VRQLRPQAQRCLAGWPGVDVIINVLTNFGKLGKGIKSMRHRSKNARKSFFSFH